MRSYAPAILLSLLACTSIRTGSHNVQDRLASPAGYGSISGLVVSEVGAPVAGADVQAMLTGVALAGWIFPETTTDANGRFHFPTLQAGKFWFGASVAGYPSANLAEAYGSAFTPVIEISPGRASPNVTIRMGPKPGVLYGTIADAATMRPILFPTISIQWNAPSKRYVGGSASSSSPPNFTEYLPVGVDVNVKIYADGYAPWHAHIRLKSGERREAQILLHRR